MISQFTLSSFDSRKNIFKIFLYLNRCLKGVFGSLSRWEKLFILDFDIFIQVWNFRIEIIAKCSNFLFVCERSFFNFIASSIDTFKCLLKRFFELLMSLVRLIFVFINHLGYRIDVIFRNELWHVSFKILLLSKALLNIISMIRKSFLNPKFLFFKSLIDHRSNIWLF